ncbi:MAG: hypothetical protein CVU74_06970 [Deltaproteobacteria bacterium HGW-Deltaproteobacteria-9]|nr:MAG: hypothetical protein CVU74_06970 [Deltaproteobacteria bacterium HGW-Deltaproteobacteria-9]
MKHQKDLTTLTFTGPRFEDHGLELGDLAELLAYKKILMETARELWRRDHPDRKYLPRGWEESVAIKFYAINEGSAGIVLKREIELPNGDLPLESEDEVDKAAKILEASMELAGLQQPPPEALPKNVIPLFEEFGKTLDEKNYLTLQAKGRATPVLYNQRIRNHLVSWVDRTYEDMVDFTGEVRAADLDNCNFTIRLGDGAKVPGRFEPSQESQLTEALREHATRRITIKGKGEFLRDSGKLRKILSVTSVSFANEPEYIASGEPGILDLIQEITAAVPKKEWQKLPKDLARNFKNHLYGVPKERE